jgi:hypothetical protein
MQSRFATTDDAKTLGALNAQLIRDEGQRLAKLLEMVPNLWLSRRSLSTSRSWRFNWH